MNVEYIVSDEISKYRKLMLAAPDEYMHERAHDVDDVMNRIIRNIQDQKLFSRLDGRVDHRVRDRSPPPTRSIFSRNQILGYATDLGGITSHAAIHLPLAEIPAVVGLRTAHQADQDRATSSPSTATPAHRRASGPAKRPAQALRRKRQRFRDFEEQLVDLAGLECGNAGPQASELSANIEFSEEMEFARHAGVRRHRACSGPKASSSARKPTRRKRSSTRSTRRSRKGCFPTPSSSATFDIGGDKLAPDAVHEANPFLGLARDPRACWTAPELFLDQLRGHPPGQRAQERSHHVSHGLEAAGSPEGQGAAGTGQGGSYRPGHAVRQGDQDRRDDRSAFGCGPRRGIAEEVDFLSASAPTT